ncbi:hypothetical protein [uncultured Ruegeria sp.]|uniref:hypothetical protein n=1 Tax=uncultured Ruegeria sp. TaxID=259304 RepID=UPI002612ED12|nr:hypothetical protein [uncultured Ruegeria sp.]
MTTLLSAKAKAEVTKPLVLGLLIFSFAMPFFFLLGGLKLNGYRTILIIFMFPAVFGWLSGRAGKIRGIDFLVIGFAFWAALSLAVNHGLGTLWEFIGMFMIETLAPYFIARTYIRNLGAFRYFVKCFFILMLILLPFAAFEASTGKAPLLDIFGKALNVYPWQGWKFPPRLGLMRAQTTMPHPILFGVFCAPAFALTWYVLGWGKSFYSRASLTSVVAGVVFFSLSSGAFLNVIIQMMLMAWSWCFQFLKSKWKILIIGFGVLFFLGEILSNRSMFQIFATHFTLSPGTAWMRIHIFNFASDDVLRNPIFGIGLNDWTRPAWMWTISSVDNFWLVIALRHGLPGLLLLVGAVAILFFRVGGKQLSGATADARLGYLISLFGLIMSAVTVHLWDATFCFLMFFLGAGVWFLDAGDESGQDGDQAQADQADKKVRYTRFSQALPGELSTGRVARAR